jgi:hypothetical protein
VRVAYRKEKKEHGDHVDSQGPRVVVKEDAADEPACHGRQADQEVDHKFVGKGLQSTKVNLSALTVPRIREREEEGPTKEADDGQDAVNDAPDVREYIRGDVAGEETRSVREEDQHALDERRA